MLNEERLKLYEKDEIGFRDKFYILMDILVTNQNGTRIESLIFISFFYIQLFAGFFSERINLLPQGEYKFDKFLSWINKCFRGVNLLINHYLTYRYVLITIFIIFFIILFLSTLMVITTTRKAFYTFKEIFFNYFIKFFIYIGFNITLDICFASLCFNDTYNPFFAEDKVLCSFKGGSYVSILATILLVCVVFFNFVIQNYYNDAYFLSNSYYSKSSCNYEIIMTFHQIVYSFLLTHFNFISVYLFLFYNLVVSIFLCFFYFKVHLYYDRITNTIGGLFHIIYCFESVYFIIFKIASFSNGGLIFIIISFLVAIWYFVSLKKAFDYKIIHSKPFNQINNKYYLIHYIKVLYEKINSSEENEDDRALLNGILQMHITECPNEKCLIKTKHPIYDPKENQWSYRDKPLIEDKIFLKSFIMVVLNYFLQQNFYSFDILISISIYYIKVLGNLYQAMYYYKKAKEMKMSRKEHFSFVRLHLLISRELVEKLKPQNDPCFSLEDINTSLYFKYEDYEYKLVKEMMNDVEYTMKFWTMLKNSKTSEVSYNDIFMLSGKIRKTKMKVDEIFQMLFEIFNGVNDIFELYSSYIEVVNDDDIKKRELDLIKKKNEITTIDMIHFNYYNVMFSNETGILIGLGDKGKEGVIVHSNRRITEIFGYDREEIEGINVSILMPKLLAENHKGFIERYFEIGEKKILDKKMIKSFGKDRDNNIFSLKLFIKTFPILNDNLLFVVMISKEKNEEIILTDSQFNIQGMSNRLSSKLNIYAKNLFTEYEVPFYIFCMKFLKIYKNFLAIRKKNLEAMEKKRKLKSRKSIKNSAISNISFIESQKQTYKPAYDLETSGLSSLLRSPKKKTDLGTIISSERGDVVTDGFGNMGDTTINNNNSNIIEFTETTEMEYEMRVPLFIKKFANYLLTSNKKANDQEEFENMNEELSIDDESETLHESGNDVSSPVSGARNESMSRLKETIAPTLFIEQPRARKTRERMSVFIQKEIPIPNEEKDFITSLNYIKSYFASEQFLALENYISKSERDNSSHDYKFNFTFDSFKFGNERGYIIHCNESKNDFDEDESDEPGGHLSQEIAQMIKQEKYMSLLNMKKILEEEKILLINDQEEFLKLSINDKEFKKLLNKNHNDIMKLSHILGFKKKETILDDENASQTSQTGYNEDLSKVKRIEEIRSNALKNVSNYYMLKYFKVIILLNFIWSIILVTCLIYLLYSQCDDLSTVSVINVSFFLSLNWFSYLVSSLMSIKSLYMIKSSKLNINYQTFTDDVDLYIDTLTNTSFTLIDNITYAMAYVERDISKYSKHKKELFWGKHKITYSPDHEDNLPIFFSKVISNSNWLLKNSEFLSAAKGKLTIIDSEKISDIDYGSKMAINYGYISLIPLIIENLETFPGEFKEYVENSQKKITYIILGHLIFVVLFISGFSAITYFTNKNIGEGLKKLTKIKLFLIDDTLRKIEMFNSTLKKYTDSKYNYSLSAFEEQKSRVFDEHEINQKLKPTQKSTIGEGSVAENEHSQMNSLDSQNKSNNADMGSMENLKAKKLKILTSTYFIQLIIAAISVGFLLPTYLNVIWLTRSSKRIIDIQEYFFGSFYNVSETIIRMKYQISYSFGDSEEKSSLMKNEEDYLVKKIYDKDTVIKYMLDFDDVIQLYENLSVGVCKLKYGDSNKEEYDKCEKSTLIKSVNNTNTIFQMIPQLVQTLLDLSLYYKEKDSNYNSFQLYTQTSFGLLENYAFNYFAPMSETIGKVTINALEQKIKSKRRLILVCIIIFFVCVFAFTGYVGVKVMKDIIHLVSVSRCVLTIIPINVINQTLELENWIEDKC